MRECSPWAEFHSPSGGTGWWTAPPRIAPPRKHCPLPMDPSLNAGVWGPPRCRCQRGPPAPPLPWRPGGSGPRPDVVAGKAQRCAVVSPGRGSASRWTNKGLVGWRPVVARCGCPRACGVRQGRWCTMLWSIGDCDPFLAPARLWGESICPVASEHIIAAERNQRSSTHLRGVPADYRSAQTDI